MLARLRGEVYLAHASLCEGDGSLQYGFRLSGERQYAPVVIRVGVQAEDAHAGDSVDAADDARDLLVVTAFAEVGDGLEERGTHGGIYPSPRARSR